MKGYPATPVIRTEIVFNRIPSAKAHIRRELPERVTRAAEALREHLKEAIDTGTYGISSDTMAYAESFFVQSPSGSDYSERLRAAANDYVNNPSRWRELVQILVDPSAYSAGHFAARVIDEEPLPQPSQDEVIAAVSTFLAIGYWWEYGHWNVLTNQYEHRPHFTPEAEAFRSEYAGFFGDLMEGFH